MDTHLAEWNETFSLISIGFQNLEVISIQIHLHSPLQTVRDTFWDGGLLELDHLKKLKGISLSVFKCPLTNPPTKSSDLFFAYSAGSLPPLIDTSNKPPPSPPPPPNQPISFHHARNRLRHQIQQSSSSSSPNNDTQGRLFFRFSMHVFPLYVRHLIQTLPRRPHRTHADIRREDRLQRNTEYMSVYLTDDLEQGEPIFGFQFRPDVGNREEYVAQGLARLRLARDRLLMDSSSQRQQQQEKGVRLPPSPFREYRGGSARQVRVAVGFCCPVEEEERPGDWRRQLTEEAFAPLIESFPMSILRGVWG